VISSFIIINYEIIVNFIVWSFTLKVVLQACYEYHLTWAWVPHIVRELSGKCQGISECLESGHPEYSILRYGIPGHILETSAVLAVLGVTMAVCRTAYAVDFVSCYSPVSFLELIIHKNLFSAWAPDPLGKLPMLCQTLWLAGVKDSPSSLISTSQSQHLDR